MNFLSHYLLTPVGVPPAYALGSILPDLSRMFDRRQRIHLLKDERMRPDLQALNTGVAHHFRTDRYFHNSTFFKRESQWVKQELHRSALQSPPRFMFFIGHVLLELAIDRMLINAQTDLCPIFYVNLERVSRKTLQLYLQHQKNIRDTETFINHYAEFLQRQHIARYVHDAYFLRTLNHVISRVGLQPFVPADHPRVIACVEKLENKLHGEPLQHFFLQARQEVTASQR